jgi:hypothetical protein
MTGAILKLSYNKVGETPVTGGVCGSFFLIRPNLAITANHVLNKTEFKPNEGFVRCQFWLLLISNIIFELDSNSFLEFPEIDLTVIPLKRELKIRIRDLSKDDLAVGIEIYNEGFIANQIPIVNANWDRDKLRIDSCDLNSISTRSDGFIRSLKTMSVNAKDIKMNNVRGIETSYGGVLGMSGGPLIRKDTDKIIGLMSIGLPPDIPVKETLFAVSTQEIINKIGNLNFA